MGRLRPGGELVSLTSEIADVINRASLPVWKVLPAQAIRDLVLQAAEAADTRTASLSPAALAYVEENERTFIRERYSHREEHLEQIEQILAEKKPGDS